MSEPAVSKKPVHTRPWFLIVVVVAAALVTFAVTALLMNIQDRKHEGATAFTKVVQVDSTTVDPAVWGQNFPVQYEGYLSTSQFVPSKHAGVLEEVTNPADPRSDVPSSKIEEDPRLKIMWNGYAFAVDYRHARGHAYSKVDQENTLRVTEFQQPGACLNCHVSTPALMNDLGDGDINKGFDALNKMPFADAAALAEHPLACIDCHDPETMDLTITRPAFMNGIAALKASQGTEDYDVNRDATRQEMRSYVCAQCHVEYYFAGEEKTVTFPWANGLDLDDTWDYYQDNGHIDFEHKTTGAQILKAQHPEFETWSQGVHAANGVGCADCHMNYQREGATKVTNHHVTTPMADLNASCGSCHETGDGVLEERIDTIQDRFIESRDRAMDAVVDLISDIEVALTDGTSNEAIDTAREYQNKASFYLDYAYSENSYGFHAPDYSQRLVSQSLDAARKGQLALTGKSVEQLEASDITAKNLARSIRAEDSQSADGK